MLDKLNILTRIIEKIKRFPVTFESMKEWIRYENIEISDRTLYRYLKDTENLHLNDGQIITFNGDCNRKTWKFEYDGSNNDLKEDDILCLMLMKGFLPGSFSAGCSESIEKIEKIIYQQQSKSKFEYHSQPLGKHEIILSPFGERNYTSDNVQLIHQVLWSVIHHRKIQLYSDIGMYTENSLPETLMPMQIIYHKGASMLMCLSEKDLKLQAIDIAGYRDIRILNLSFDFNKYEAIYNEHKNKRFGIEENINEDVYDIILVFSKNAGEVIRRKIWHSSQKDKTLSNGNIEFRLHCGINNELIEWILQWNKDVDIYGPPVLLQKVCEHTTALLDHYSSENLI